MAWAKGHEKAEVTRLCGPLRLSPAPNLGIAKLRTKLQSCHLQDKNLKQVFMFFLNSLLLVCPIHKNYKKKSVPYPSA